MTANAGTWCVVCTHAHQENKAALNLKRQGFDIYAPRYLRRRRHARRSEIVPRPLYPRYLFVRIDPLVQRWRAINSTYGVAHLLCHGDRPAPVDETIIQGLQAREDETGFIRLEPQRRLKPGDAVRVLDGAFANCLGLFEGIADSQRIAILLDMLGQKVRVLLNSETVEAAR